jgi:hypothetical protein
MVTRSWESKMERDWDWILKHKTRRPSRAHSARRRPSVPVSIRADHSSSRPHRIRRTNTRPNLAQAAKTYSEPGDQSTWVMTFCLMLSASRAGLAGLEEATAIAAAEGVMVKIAPAMTRRHGRYPHDERRDDQKLRSR